MITMIACIDQQRGLGHNNKLLCKLPNDQAHFKKHTKSKICIQGRKTYESIISQLGHDLPERTNIILTKDKKYKAERGAYVFHSVEEIIDKHKSHGDDQEIMILGGEEIYKQFLPYVNKLLLTIVHHSFENVDTYFPQISLDEWKVASHITHKADDRHDFDYSFITYERK